MRGAIPRAGASSSATRRPGGSPPGRERARSRFGWSRSGWSRSGWSVCGWSWAVGSITRSSSRTQTSCRAWQKEISALVATVVSSHSRADRAHSGSAEATTRSTTRSSRSGPTSPDSAPSTRALMPRPPSWQRPGPATGVPATTCKPSTSGTSPTSPTRSAVAAAMGTTLPPTTDKRSEGGWPAMGPRLIRSRRPPASRQPLSQSRCSNLHRCRARLGRRQDEEPGTAGVRTVR